MLFASLTLLLNPSLARSDTHEALLFDAAASDGKLICRMQYSDVREGGRILRSTTRHTDPAGDTLVTETVEYRSGKVNSYHLVQHQTGDEGWAWVEHDQLRMRFLHEGRFAEAVEPLTGDIVVGPALLPFLADKMAELKEHKAIYFRLVVLDRMESVRFEARVSSVRRVGETQSLMRVEVAPQNRFLSLLAPPVEISLEEYGGNLPRVLALLAPSAALVKRDKRLVPFQARMEFQSIRP